MSESSFAASDARHDAIRAETLESIERVRATGQTRWIARVIDAPVPDGLRCYAHAGTRDRFYWESVETSSFHCAWGAVDEIESAGSDRYRAVRAWSRDLCGRLDWLGEARSPAAPSFFGGFGFEEDAPASAEWKAFPSARFVLPEILVERDASAARWIFFARVEPGASLASIEETWQSRLEEVEEVLGREAAPVNAIRDGSDGAASSPAGWEPGPEYRVRADRAHGVFEGQVESALSEIESGRLEKIVLARSLRVDHDGELDVPDFMGRLRSLYPSCVLIAVGRGQDTFLAATPETLVTVSGRAVETAALAGSAPRGRQPEEDRALGAALLEDSKERREHAYVVEAIRGVLEARCEALEISNAPRLRQLFGIQHLESAVRGRLCESDPAAEPVDVLSLVEALHPTPAVGGVPAAAAADWLSRYEGLERGWYAAPVGWLDLEGGGNFRVALRSALIHNGVGGSSSSMGSRALLFAGAGIVAGSDPGRELIETRVKLRALLAPLTEI